MLLLSLGLVYSYAYVSKSTPALPTKHILIGLSLALVCAYRAIQSPCTIVQATPLAPKYACHITGIVSDTQIKPSDRFSYVIRLNQVQMTPTESDETVSINGLIDVHVPRVAWLLPGDEIAVSNAKLKPTLNTSLEPWAIRHGIAATSFVENGQVRKTGRTLSIARSIAKYKIDLLKKIKPYLNEDAYRLFKAIMLGMTTSSNATDILRCKFQTWGLAHMLARSGLHMTLIALTVSLALSPLGIASTVTLLLNLLLLIGLCFLSWNGLSFMRAIYMWTLSQCCIYLKRRPNVMHNLGLVATGCLLWQPYFIFSLDFQLTFFVTAALIIINSKAYTHVVQKSTSYQRTKAGIETQI